MQKRKPTTGVRFFLFMVFLIGIGINVFIVLDAEYMNWFIHNKGMSEEKTQQGADNANLSFVETSKQSILVVLPKDCAGQACGFGTGFVIKPGYVATNAHVVTCGERCEDISLKDYRGRNHSAKIEAIASSYGKAEDLAILKIDDTSIPPLKLADSSQYEVQHDGDEVITIGYPLVGHVSSLDKASVSGKGSLSTYKVDESIFVTSGMNINAGNSGGPVFLIKSEEVLGIATSVVRGKIFPGNAPVEGVDYVIPINRLKNYFRERIGQDIY